MLSRFFIDRPIFAWVVAIVIMLAGALAITSLPVEQYPSIALPQVSVSANYPGASAASVENSVTDVIEQRMKGLDGLIFMSSTSGGDGSSNVNLTFKAGTNPDIAQVQVQNKLQSAIAELPAQVQQTGISVTKTTNSYLIIFAFYSTDSKMTDSDVGDYIASSIQDPISRVPGVGDINELGSQYAMRIWLDPNKLTSLNLTPADVIAAVQAQNSEVTVGQVGGTPAAPGAPLNATITAQSRLQTPAQFEQIVLKSDPGGAVVRLGDVARVQLGAENYNILAHYHGLGGGGMAVKLAPGANALSTAKAVKAKMAELATRFPSDLRYFPAVDTTPFIERSINEVVRTLVEAIVLVFLVMFLFLQNWRATLIPTIAVPVVLLGTFAVLRIVGYTINTLTMFGLALAIGLLVDDAIVVVENVERLMSEEGLSPIDATRKSMQEITGALIGIALVLVAVFVPMAFFGGSQGVIYRQFSVTMISAMSLSVMVALVLTPALCATLLKPVADPNGALDQPGFFGWFNRNFDQARARYLTGVRGIVGRTGRMAVIYVVILAAVGLLFLRLPTSFLPDEDQGQLFNVIQLPPGATIERTLAVLKQVEKHYQQEPAVDHTFAVAGFSFAGQAQNAGTVFANLKDFSQRKAKRDSVQAIAQRATIAFMGIRDAFVFPVVIPPVPELGLASGFDFELQDVSGVGHARLMAARNQLLGMAAQDPLLAGVRPNGLDDTPQLRIDIDQAKAGAMGLNIADINDTLSSALGGTYVDDFVDRGRVKRVYVQADAPYRMTPNDLNRWYVRNAAGQMVPFDSFANVSWTVGSPRLERYDGVPSVEIQGTPAPGKSTGQAMAEMERLVAKLPPGLGYEWTGLSLQEREAGAQAPALYALSILVVFLVLAALYESWSIPLAVILAIPLGVLGALLATTLRGLSNDIYFQVGLLTTMGLCAKNAILIIEFAKEAMAQGKPLVEATVEAARIRIRPILMTSMAFVFGVMPLAISSGAGSGGQHAIGTGVIGGMLAVTALGIFFTPVFFVLVQGLFGRKRRPATDAAPGEAV